MPNGPHKITGLNFDPEIADTDKKIDDLDIQASRKQLITLITLNKVMIMKTLS